jgi:uncharacterized membrane protein
MFGYDWPRLHAALNDLPAALLLAAVIFEAFALATKRESLRAAGFWTLLGGVVGAVVAVLSGLQAEDKIAHSDAVHEIMETHEKLAFVTLGIFAVVLIWRLVRQRKWSHGERVAAFVLSLAGVGAVVATGVEGGEMVFEHAAGIPTPVLETEAAERAAGHHHHAEGGADEHATDEAHDHGTAASADSSTGHSHTDTVGTAAAHSHSEPHTHTPGTPPHKD